MSKLLTNDLPRSVELDRAALKTVYGGYYTYKLEKVLISSYSVSGGSSADQDQSTQPVKAASLAEYGLLL